MHNIQSQNKNRVKNAKGYLLCRGYDLHTDIVHQNGFYSIQIWSYYNRQYSRVSKRAHMVMLLVMLLVVVLLTVLGPAAEARLEFNRNAKP